MARSKASLGAISGVIGPVVVKQYVDKIVLTARPDMSKVKRTKIQKANSRKFAKAVAYAKDILADPEKKKAFARSLKKGQSVYPAAVRQYLLENSKAG